MPSSCARAGCTRGSRRCSSRATRAGATSGVRRSLRALLLFFVLAAVLQANAQTVKVGSKRFTESYILGEILARAADGEHRPGLGNTAILYEALRSGAIDAYPEYCGTIARVSLKTGESLDIDAISPPLKPLGPAASTPLGFSNSYALVSSQHFIP